MTPLVEITAGVCLGVIGIIALKIWVDTPTGYVTAAYTIGWVTNSLIYRGFFQMMAGTQ